MSKSGFVKTSSVTRKCLFIMVLCFSLCLSVSIPSLMASEIQTNMRHSPPGYFVPEARIQLEARVSDPSGIELVRCYFKAAGESDFVFVPMTNIRRNNYAGVLPAPSASTKQIEYLFLSVNSNNEIVKSQTFLMSLEHKDKLPSWQDMDKTGEIQVSMELDQIPDDLAGFSDNIAMNTVESSLRFGLVAGGLYQLTGGTAGAGASASAAGAGASVSGSAASAATAGTVTAGAAGVGTAGAVAAGVGAAAAVGGAAAAGGGGGGGSGGSSNGPKIEESDLVGTYYVTVVDIPAAHWNMTMELHSNGNWTGIIRDDYGQNQESGTWEFRPSTNHMIARRAPGLQGSFDGKISGTVQEFTVPGTWDDGTPRRYRLVRQ